MLVARISRTKKAARLHSYGKPLVLEEVPTPRPAAGEVLVRVEAAGFRHSDIRVMDGEIQILARMPLTLGRENAGTVGSRRCSREYERRLNNLRK